MSGHYACLAVGTPIPCYMAKELPGDVLTLFMHDNENNEISMNIMKIVSYDRRRVENVLLHAHIFGIVTGKFDAYPLVLLP